MPFELATWLHVLTGDWIESCIPGPFIFGDRCGICKEVGRTAQEPESVEITDVGDEAPRIHSAIGGGLYIHSELVPAFARAIPGLRLITPQPSSRFAQRYKEQVRAYQRLVADTDITLTDQSVFAFEATCKSCGHKLWQMRKEPNDVLLKQRLRLKEDDRFDVREHSLSRLRFSAARVPTSGLYRWESQLFATAHLRELIEEHVGRDWVAADVDVQVQISGSNPD